MATVYGSLTPAFGRDYKNKQDILKDFLANKDFVLHGFNEGGYINRPQLVDTPSIQVRYSRLMKIAILKQKKGTWTI